MDAESIVGLVVVVVLGTAAWIYLFGPRAEGATFGSPAMAWAALKEWGANAPERLRASREAAARERAVGVEVPLSPTQVLDEASEYMARSGYALESRTHNAATFSRSAQMDPAVGCFLALLFLIPALIYMLAVAGKTTRTTLATYPHEGGSRLVIGGDDPRGVKDLTWWARHLRTQLEESDGPEGSHALAAPDIPAGMSAADRLRELADLRKAGLITAEEYDATRARILEEM